MPPEIVAHIVSHHAEEAAFLHFMRTVLTKAPHARLEALGRFDDRLAAHLDGLSVASDGAWPFCEAALNEPTAGAVFTAAIHAVEQRSKDRFDRLFEIAEAAPELCQGLVSALGWLSRDHLRGLVVTFLDSVHPLRRAMGIAACAAHRVDPGLVAAHRLQDPDRIVRARSLRAAGQLGSTDAMRICVAGRQDDDPDCHFWSAWSAVLLGDRNRALATLIQAAAADGEHRRRALCLAMQALQADAAHSLLRELGIDRTQLRWLIHGSGIAGDPGYIPWILNHMRDDKTARLAGEAFTLIAGADLSALQLDRAQPEGIESGPNEDPDDPNVDMDPDEGLPWPDVQKVENWWAANAGRFQKGTRYFMGAPVTREHCIEVLKHGYQRQRILAAHYLCLLNPGTPLFNTSAPAWRQQRLLAKM